MPSSTSQTVVAVFENYAAAERAVAALVSGGFPRDTIQITSDTSYRSDAATGNTGLSGHEPTDASGGGLGGFFRRLFGADEEYAGHYDEAVRRGGAVVSVVTTDEERAADILERSDAVNVEERAASSRQQGNDAPMSRERARTGDQSIPVVREEIHVGKRDVQRGGVRVFSTVQQRPVEEQVQLREEHVRVDRRAVDRPATDADFRGQDEVIELREMAEEPVVAKSARVVEEVVLGKETTQRTETIHDTVRNTEVKVENLGGRDRSQSSYDEDFQQDFRSRYGSVKGARYESYAPGYQYGYRMASDDRYRGKRWEDVESTLRSDYERTSPGGTWEQMKDSVRYGWEKVTGRR